MTDQSIQRPTSRREEFARGWPVVFGSMIFYSVSIAAIPIYVSGAFMTDLSREFGVGRGDIALGHLARTCILVLLSPLVGHIADRYGIRRPVAVSLIGMAIVYLLMGSVMNSLTIFILLQAASGFVGAASLPVVFTRAVNSWFDKARGLALGTCLVGTGITATIGPTLISWMITHHGWRSAYLAIAVTILAFTPMIVWLVRLAPWEVNERQRNAEGTGGMSLREAASHRFFWVMGMAFFLQSVAVMGMISHFLPLLTDSGIDKLQAAKIVGLIGAAIIVGRFVVGALMDYIFGPWIAAAVCLLSLAGFLTLAIGGVGWASFAAAAIGFSVGAEVDVIGFLSSRYFGLRAYGRIYGVLFATFMMGSAFSEFWIGGVFDRFHSYEPALLISAGMLVVVIGLLLTLPHYAKPGE